MKRTFLKLFAFALVTLVLSCAGSGGDPKSVAKNFFEALKMMNIDEASKYATKDSKSMLDLLKMGTSMAPINMDSLKTEMNKQKVAYGDPVINGDEATITVTVNDKDKTNFKLKKEDGLWKVAFDKNTMMKAGMEKMEQHGASDADMKEAQEAMDHLGSDSLNQVLQEAGKTLDSLAKQ